MWPEPVERVAAVLREARADARLEEFPSGTPTARDAAKAAGVDVAQIVKSLVFLCDGRPVVALVPGDRRADAAKIAAEVGARRAEVARPAEVEAATGFAPGAVAPFPLPPGVTVLLDASLLVHEVVWAGGGSPNHMVQVRPQELLRLTKARQMDAVEDRTYDSG